MLIRFTMSNYLSFNQEVELSMIPGKSRNHPHHVVKGDKRSSIGLLKAGIIYGANASGKSNLVKGIAFARDLVLEGTRPKKAISRIPFKLDPACAGKPSRFQFEFKLGARAYAYGFELDSQRIESEWLYEITKTTQKKVFERRAGAAEGDGEIELGKIRFSNKDEQTLVRLLKPRQNQLFLTQSVEAGVKQFEPLVSWFRRLITIFPEGPPEGLGIRIRRSTISRESLENILAFFDTGISGITLRPVELTDSRGILPLEVQLHLKESLDIGDKTIITDPNNSRYLVSLNPHGQLEAYKFMMHHKGTGGSGDVLLDICDESDGTRRIIDLIPALHMALEKGAVCLIDELDRSLHPALSSKILELFLNSKANENGQLIVTTHESGLMDLKLLRRDEIWFVEKSGEGASTVYSLEEFLPRYDKDVRKGYLLGRFGAVPILGDATKFLWGTA